MTTLTETERKVLEIAAENSDFWLNHFYEPILRAAGGFEQAQAVCQNLRRRKLFDGHGRGKFAEYGINDAGRTALEVASVRTDVAG